MGLSCKGLNLLIKLKHSFRKGGFASHVTTMLAGNISAQAIAFIAAPFITRLYSPDDFGSLTLVWSYIGIFSVIACLRYESPIIIEEETGKAYNIFLLCIIIAACFSLFLAGIIFFIGKQVAAIIGLKGSANFLWFIPLGVFSFAVNQALTYPMLCMFDDPMFDLGASNPVLNYLLNAVEFSLKFFSKG